MAANGSTALLKAYFGLTALAPWLLRRMARKAHDKQGAARHRRAERFGRATLARPQGKLIWLHAASVGEVQSVAALAPLLTEHATLLVTTTTQTGAQRVSDALPSDVLHQFAPIDTANSVEHFLCQWQPDLALFVESDVWPRMSARLAARKTPTALINARASRSRARFARSYRALLSPFAVITCQSPAVRDGLKALELPSTTLACVGDLKADLPALRAAPDTLKTFQQAARGRPVWAAVSTHAEDEAEVRIAHQALLAEHPNALLLWLPRHPDRASAIEAAIKLPLARRSRKEVPNADTSVFLIDTLGETGAAFQVAPFTFLGGSFGPQGGHTPYEPTAAGSYVLYGPNVANFSAAYADLTRHKAAEPVSNGAALGARLINLVGSGKRPAQSWSRPGKPDAAKETLALLLPLLARQPR